MVAWVCVTTYPKGPRGIKGVYETLASRAFEMEMETKRLKRLLRKTRRQTKKQTAREVYGAWDKRRGKGGEV